MGENHLGRKRAAVEAKRKAEVTEFSGRLIDVIEQFMASTSTARKRRNDILAGHVANFSVADQLGEPASL